MADKKLPQSTYDTLTHKMEQLIKANYLMQERIKQLEAENAELTEQTMTEVRRISAGQGFIIEDLRLKAGIIKKYIEDMEASEVRDFMLEQLEEWRATQYKGYPLYAMSNSVGKVVGLLICNEFKNKAYVDFSSVSCIPRYAGMGYEAKFLWSMMSWWYTEGFKRIKMEVEVGEMKFHLEYGAIVWGFNGKTGDAFIDIPIRPSAQEQLIIAREPESYINHDDPRWQLLPSRGALKNILEKSRRGAYAIPHKDLLDAVGKQYIRIDPEGLITGKLADNVSKDNED